ncbi:RTA1-domain-containing protein [Panus rudis PR-1116 ss-1]|nr:RTA1-domain-containing protein [Panus rudis PR-1116 ss-1]
MSADNGTVYPPGTFGPDGQILMSPYYNYLLDKSACFAFVILYSLTTTVHLGEAIYWRMWWLLPTVVLGGIGEIIGWSGRLWSAFNPLIEDPFMMQICATIIAPTPFVAALFMTFARVTECLGSEYSRISSRIYKWLFMTCDIISLFIQAAGGGLAATASTDSGSNLGGNIMLVGIIFQLVSLIVFVALSGEFLVRYVRDMPFRESGERRRRWDSKMKLLIGGLCFITLFIFIRSIYRTIELSDGWNGRIISTQIYFNVLDGMMVLLAMITFNVFHPGYLLMNDYSREPVVTLESGNSALSSQTTMLELDKINNRL